MSEARFAGRDFSELKNAQWIGGAGNAFLRRKFVLAEPLISARLYVIADLHSYAKPYCMRLDNTGNEGNWLLGGSFIKYRIWINGIQIGVGPFRPVVDGISVLHAFDITGRLRTGDNVVGVISRGEKNGCAILLELELANGKKERIMSGNDWSQLDGNDIYRPVCWETPNIDQHFKGCAGPGEYFEHIDGNKFPFGWTIPDFDDSTWCPATTFGAADGKYEFADMPNYVLTPVSPVLVKKLGEAHYFIDFGREVVAGLELDSPPGGGTVELRLGEELLSPDRVRFQMRTQNCYQELWNFTADGGMLTNFGIRAFRYAEIIGWNGEMQIENVRAVTVNAPFKWGDSVFNCSNSDLTRVWQFCKNSIAYTSLDVYTDCPSRERISYESDSYITMLTHFAVERNVALARRTLEYQLHHPTWPCEWRQFIIPLFYEYLMHTGDYALVSKHYETLKNNYSFHHLLTRGLVNEFPHRIIIDWPEKSRDGYEFGPDNAVANAFVYWDLVLLQKLAHYLGRDQDAQAFFGIAGEVKNAFNRVLFDQEQGLYRDNSESRHCSFHANMFALNFGLVPESRVDGCLNFIVDKGMACSVYVAQFYLETLFQYGRADQAVKLMTADNKTSWLGMIRLGATITCEAWSPHHKSNMSWAHPWGSSPGNIISRYLFGLRATAPGWTEYMFEPQPGGLEYGQITTPTPRGLITATFKIYQKRLIKKLSIKQGV